MRIETVKDYRIKFGLETNEGGLPGIEKSQQGPTPMATASTAIPSSTSVTEDPHGGAAPAAPSSSSAGEPRGTIGEAAEELVIAKRDCGTIMQPDEYILNPMASINLPKSYTRTQCQNSQPAGFNYCRGCGIPIVSKTEIPGSLQEEIKSITALVLPRTLVFKSTIGGASGKGCV